jgi:hypothetical protein
MHLVSLDAPERQFVDFCALRALLDLRWDCTLWIALAADRERRARLGVNDGDPCLQVVDAILRAWPLAL